jgi:hypothetical protein
MYHLNLKVMKRVFTFIVSSFFAVSALFAEDVTLSFDNTSSKTGVTFNVSPSSEFPYAFRIENIDNQNMYRLFDADLVLASYKGIEFVFDYGDVSEIPEKLQFFFSTDGFGRGYYPYVVDLTTSATLTIDFTDTEKWPDLWVTSDGSPIAADKTFNRFGFRSDAPRRQNSLGDLELPAGDNSYIMDVYLQSMALVKDDGTKEYFNVLGGGMYGTTHSYRIYGESVSLTLSNAGELVWDISEMGADVAKFYLATPLDAEAAANFDILVNDYDVPSIEGVEEGSSLITVELEDAYQLILTTLGGGLTLDVEKIVLSGQTSLAVVPEDEIVAQALPAGVSTTLLAKFTPSTVSHIVTWSSADENIAAVDAETGVVTGVSAGEVAITATSTEDPSLTGSYTVTVIASNIAVNSVSLDVSALNLKMLNSATLPYTISPANATIRTVTWSSADESIATVDASTGKITPVSAGTTDIIVTTDDGGKTADCAVTVIGYLPIPAGYVSLYSLDFNLEGTAIPLSSGNGAIVTLPGIISSNGNSLLGSISNWNRNNRYVNLADYDEVQIAAYFKTEDIGKSIIMRYTFAGASDDATSTASIVEPEIAITQENQLITIDLVNEATDTDYLRRLCAIKFKNSSSGEIKFNVDYVALRPTNFSGIENIFVDELPAFVNVYNVMGQLLKPNVARESALDGLANGIYIVNHKKVIVSNRK